MVVWLRGVCKSIEPIIHYCYMVKTNYEILDLIIIFWKVWLIKWNHFKKFEFGLNNGQNIISLWSSKSHDTICKSDKFYENICKKLPIWILPIHTSYSLIIIRLNSFPLHAPKVSSVDVSFAMKLLHTFPSSPSYIIFSATAVMLLGTRRYATVGN